MRVTVVPGLCPVLTTRLRDLAVESDALLHRLAALLGNKLDEVAEETLGCAKTFVPDAPDLRTATHPRVMDG